MMMGDSLLFIESNVNAKICPGDTIASVAGRNGIFIDQPCAGKGDCGKCRVLVEKNAPCPTDKEKRLLSEQELISGIRLACQAAAVGGMEVKVVDKIPQKVQILDSVDRANFNEEYTGQSDLAVAIDIGTTTLVAYLIDKLTGNVIATVSSMNPQAVFGADVISRISSIEEDPSNLPKMQHSLVSEINSMMAKLLTKDRSIYCHVNTFVAVGNSTMEHIFAGISPACIGRAPFAPAFYEAPKLYASDVGIDLKNTVALKLLPNISGFVGGDIVSGIVYSGMAKSKQLSLLIDIGTNNEMVLGNSEHMLCCSAAAGPALEGAKISCGMRAASGAIEKAWRENGDIKVKTIYDAPVEGICGSGLVDVIAFMIDEGIIRPNGKFANIEDIDAPALAKRLTGVRAAERLFVLAEKKGRFIGMTQKDIREFQLAKAAIKTGIELMLAESDFSIDDIDNIYLAGAFGSYMDISNAIKTGLLPNVPLSKITPIGNSSGLGACRFAVADGLWTLADYVRKNTAHMELATHKDFQSKFIKNLEF